MTENPVQKFVEEIILIFLILMNVFEFIGLLPGDAGFLKVIISMTALGYVLFKVSLSDTFFGTKNQNLDFILISTYLLLIINKFFEFSKASIDNSLHLHDFFIWLVLNGKVIERYSFYFGTIMLFIISIYVLFKIEIKEPSIVQAILGDSYKKISLFITVFIVILGFHQIFFNLIMEWFTLVIDAPLIILAIFLYMFKFRDLTKSMDQDIILFKITDFVEEFVEKFVTLFHSKKTIFLGISGMLVLHLLTDVGAFIIPYTFGTHSIYSENLGENHLPIKDLFTLDKEIIVDKGQQTILFFGYIFNTLGFLYLMIFPAYIWYIMYFHKKEPEQQVKPPPDTLVGLFFSLMVFVWFLPVYKISSIGLSGVKNLLGVDIQTQSILTSGNSILFYSGIALGIFVIVFILSKIDFIKTLLLLIMTLSGVSFFGMYIYSFFSDVFFYNIDFIKDVFLANNLGGYYLAFYNSIILFILVLFYIGGFFSFVMSVFKSE